MKKLFSALASLTLFTTLNSDISTVHAQGTAFSYQGQLQKNGQPANGSYDFAFTLYTTNVTGVPVSGPVTNTAVGVTNGLFATAIDFGNVYDGESNWLEIAVSTNGANAFSTLAPRQQLRPVPYAITAANLSGVVSSAQLPSTVITNGASGVNFSGTFSGDGSGITNVPGTLTLVIASSTNIAAQPDVAYDVTNSALVNFSLPTNANVGDIIQVDGAGAGGWQVDGMIPNDYVWTEATNAPVSAEWLSIASSADGTHLAAVVFQGGIWTSTNSGVNWTQSSAPTPGFWRSIASSSDGTHLAAVIPSGGIYTSPDSGVTWTQQTNAPTSANWDSIASSSDGTHLAAVAFQGGIWTSPDGGVTWTEQTGAPNSASTDWYSIASSSDGTHLAAVAYQGGIWTSPDSGVTWVEQSNAPINAIWESIASASDGTHLAAITQDGEIWVSTNTGTNWTQVTNLPTADVFNRITSSSDGSHLAVSIAGGGIWTSANGGANWTEQTSASNSANTAWYSIASSSDGAHLAAVWPNGGIWTGVNGIAGAPGTSAQFQYLGNGVWQSSPSGNSYLSANSTVSTIPGNLVTNGQNGVTLSGTFSGNGSGLTSISSTALPSNLVTNNESGVTLSGTFSGDGSGLTSLPSNVITNTETSATLSGNFTGNLAGNASTASLATNVVPGIFITNAFITNSIFAGNGHSLTNLNTTNFIGTLQSANFQTATITNFVAIGPLGPATFTFTTHGNRLIITTDGSGSTSTTTGVIIGMTVSFDSKLINTNRVFVNVATHAAFVPQTFITNGVTAGSHTITLTAWNGTSTDLNDNFNVTVQELPY